MYNEAVFDLLVPPSEGHEKLQIVKKGKETVVQVILIVLVSTYMNTYTHFNILCYVGLDRD